jgi:hypothetical protein
MKSAIPSDLLKLKKRFEGWRKTRAKRSKTPDRLLKAAAALLELSDAEKIVRRWQIGACRLRVGRECEDRHECDQSDSSQFHIHPFLYSFGA